VAASSACSMTDSPDAVFPLLPESRDVDSTWAAHCAWASYPCSLLPRAALAFPASYGEGSASTKQASPSLTETLIKPTAALPRLGLSDQAAARG